jgi:hypothetical protein
MLTQTGNMWNAYKDADLFLITTNSFVKKDGRLVMGAGIAKQARDRYTDLDLSMGQYVEDNGGHLGRYGLIVSNFWPLSRMGLFQVKYHWRDSADISLVEFSTNKLLQWIKKHDKENVMRIHLNYPAIGNGGLTEEKVFPIISELPDNVTVWKYNNVR